MNLDQVIDILEKQATTDLKVMDALEYLVSKSEHHSKEISELRATVSALELQVKHQD